MDMPTVSAGKRDELNMSAIAALLEAFFSKPVDHNRIAHEAIDLMQATQTLLYMLAKKHEVDVSAAMREVQIKNRERGYYEQGA